MPSRRIDGLDPKTQVAFEQWLASQVDTVVLRCRVGRHKWPDPFDKACHVTKPAVLNGRFLIEADCERGCGVSVTRYVGTDGIIERSIPHYDYPDNDATGRAYLLPREARSGHGLTKEQRGLMFLELIKRRVDDLGTL
jgi:hypothetical protein